MEDQEAVNRLEAAKHRATLQVLFRVARLLDEAAIEEVRRRFGVPGLRRAHLQLLPHLDLGGTRLTVLAERVGVSKQAVGQLVDELVTMGLLGREADPEDGRAKRVVFAGGPEVLLPGLQVLAELEAKLREAVGAEVWDGLRAGLLRVSALLDAGWVPGRP